MKRFWRYWLSVVATASIVASANAQQRPVSGEIGSYQSIMSKAGLNQGTYELATTRNVRNAQVGQPQQGGAVIVNQEATAAGPIVDAAPSQMMGRAVVDNPAPTGYIGNGAIVQDGTACGDSGMPCNSANTAGCSNSFFDGGMAAPAARSSNWVGGARALFFTRSGESPVPIARNGAGNTLLSTVNDYGTMPGAEAILTRRTCNNLGTEFRYWGLYPNQRNYTFNGPGLDTYLTGLGNFLVAPGPTNVLTYFNAADNLQVSRNNEFHNVEVNGLRNGGTYNTLLGGRTGTYEMLAGARWFQFNEDYRIAAINGAGLPSQINYDLATRNTLLGFQVGGRTESCLTDRLSLVNGTRVGLFNNRSSATQCIKTETGALAYLNGDPTAIYNYSAERDSLAMLGEVDMGVAYRFTNRLRANIGYRLIGVSGLALAPNQIPRNFVNNGELNRVKSNDSLILGGGYAGLDMCF